MTIQKNIQDPGQYIEMYKRLNNAVKTALGSDIDKKMIENEVKIIASVFINDPYNPLLLYSYSTSKDSYLAGHIANNIILAIGFGVSLNLSEENLINLGLCAFCHDFGMMEYMHLFQDNKKLADYENRLIQKHPLKSSEMFKGIFTDEIIHAIEDVHEHVDGNGYPKGKIGSEISFLAKIMSICDVYEALTHTRNVREKIIPYEAMKLIIKQKDKIFDDKVVKRFVDFMSIFPVGSLVALNTGEVGIVTASNYGYPTRCVVRIILTASQEVDRSNKIVNLLEDTMVYVSSSLPLNEEGEILRVLSPRGKIDLD